MSEFDLNGWGYNKATVLSFLEMLNTKGCFIDPTSWERFGGKFMSLSVSDALCRQMGNREIRVPPWLAIDRLSSSVEVKNWIIQQLREDVGSHFTCDVLRRSSSLEEDWMDDHSGVHESEVVHVSSRSDDVEDVISGLSQPAVFQMFVKGVGIVLDVGYSSLMESVVVRAAVGNLNYESGRTEYTSPTWDYRANLALFRETGEEIVPYTTHLFPQVLQMIQQRIPDLVRGLRQMGINFGVQIELVVHPECPSVWWMVQVRPSPEMLRGDQESFSSIPKDFNLLCRTLRMNKPGVCVGKVVCSSKEYDGIPVDRLASNLGTHYFSDRLAHLSNTKKRLLKTRVVVWDNVLDHEASFASLRGAGIMGAEGQVTYEYTFGNFAHGFYQKLNRFLKPIYEDGRGRGLIVGLPRNAWHQVFRSARANHLSEIMIRSDGLIAEVYWKQ